MRTLHRGILLAAALCFVAETAHAQGFQLERYEPTPAGSWFFGVVHPWYSSTRWVAAGLTLDYAHDPLLAGIYDGEGHFHQTSPVVEHMLVGHIDIAASFLDRVQLNASLPITLLEKGSTQFGVSPSSAGVGDPRFGIYVRLFGQPDRDAFSLHLGGYVWIPTGQAKEHLGDKTARGLPQLIAAGLVKKHLRWAFNLGFLIRATSTIGFGPASAGSEFQASLGLAYADLPRRFQVGPELMFGTALTDNHAFKNYFTNLDVLVGGQYNIARLINIGAAVGAGTLSELGTPDARVIFRLAYAPIKEVKPPPPPDRDKDGVIDPEDACPDEPGVRTNDPKTNGCPDRDHDGIPDSQDLCPDQATGSQPDAEKKGCPVVDADHDGVPDSMDLCPGESVGDKPDPKRPGCPFVDKDNDGVADAEDLCPGDAPGKYPDPKRPGCPMPDADGDGIPDSMDACPNAAGVADEADAKQNGCPKVEIKRGGTAELKMVNFEVNKWVLLPNSFEVLDALAKMLNDHPEYKKIRVEGHASDEGTHEWNMRLSRKRAQTVMEYLIKKGVKRSRLSYIGYGDTRPLVPGQTEEARSKNRRVEIRILDLDEGAKK